MLLLTGLKLWNSRWWTEFFPQHVNGLESSFFWGVFFSTSLIVKRGSSDKHCRFSVAFQSQEQRYTYIWKKKKNTQKKPKLKTSICCLIDPTSRMSYSTCFYFIWEALGKLQAHFFQTQETFKELWLQYQAHTVHRLCRTSRVSLYPREGLIQMCLQCCWWYQFTG